MIAITQHQLYDWAVGTCVTCSILHTFLPPWDFLNDFPKAQKYYKVVVYIIGYIAINGRSTIYRSIAVKNGGTNGTTQSGTSTPATPVA